MSDPTEGLNPTSTDTTARQTLASLRHRLGTTCPAAGVPDVVEVLGMSREVWVRLGVPSGEATVYGLKRGGG